MKRGPIIHGVLLLAMLLFAYQTWTRDEKVERKTTGDIQIWSVPENAITAVVYDTKDKTVRVEKRSDESGASYLWGTQTLVTRTKKAPPRPPQPAGDAGVPQPPPEPIEETQTTTREFTVGQKGRDLIGHMADLRALRSLGDPSEDEIKDFGLADSEENITVAMKEGSKSLVVGGMVFGGRDRYVREPETGKVYVVAGVVLNDLVNGESMLRLNELHEYEDDAVAKAVVTVAGKTRDLVRITVDDEEGKKTKNWALASTPGKPEQTMANFLKNVDSLRPSRYEPELDAKELELKVKVEYFDTKGSKLGWVELYEKAEEAAAPVPPPAPDKDEPGVDEPGKDEAAKAEPGKDANAGHDHGAEPAKPEPGKDGQAAADKDAAKQPPKEPPKKRSYYIRTELTRTFAGVPLGQATRITEDIDQIFSE